MTDKRAYHGAGVRKKLSTSQMEKSSIEKKLVLLTETRQSVDKIQIATFISLQLGTIKCKSKAGNHFLFLIIQASFCKLPLSHALPLVYNILTGYVGFNVQPSEFTTCSTVKDKPLKWCDSSG